jgi:hypothetical protein
VVDRYLAEVADELTWASIVAGFDAPSTDQVPRWPASEDVDQDQADPTAPDGVSDPWHGESGARGSARIVRPAELDPPDSADPAPTPAVEDEHFEPPPPPPLPVPDTLGRFAWAAVLGGPLFLVVATLFELDVAGWPGFLAIAAFVAGFVTLVARMKDRPPTDLGGDDGAVV